MHAAAIPAFILLFAGSPIKKKLLTYMLTKVALVTLENSAKDRTKEYRQYEH